MRKGGAAARAMLVQAAALAVGACRSGECAAAASVVTHTPSRRHAAVRGGGREAAGKLPVPENVTVKDPAQWTIIGKR